MISEHAETAGMIHLVSREADGVQIRLGECATVVTLRAGADGAGVMQVAQSHWIRTTDSGRPRRPQSFAGMAARQALGAAIGDLAFHFRRGLENGGRPQESWFVSIPMLVAD